MERKRAEKPDSRGWGAVVTRGLWHFQNCPALELGWPLGPPGLYQPALAKGNPRSTSREEIYRNPLAYSFPRERTLFFSLKIVSSFQAQLVSQTKEAKGRLNFLSCNSERTAVQLTHIPVFFSTLPSLTPLEGGCC